MRSRPDSCRRDWRRADDGGDSPHSRRDRNLARADGARGRLRAARHDDRRAAGHQRRGSERRDGAVGAAASGRSAKSPGNHGGRADRGASRGSASIVRRNRARFADRNSIRRAWRAPDSKRRTRGQERCRLRSDETHERLVRNAGNNHRSCLQGAAHPGRLHAGARVMAGRDQRIRRRARVFRRGAICASGSHQPASQRDARPCAGVFAAGGLLRNASRGGLLSRYGCAMRCRSRAVSRRRRRDRSGTARCAISTIALPPWPRRLSCRRTNWRACSARAARSSAHTGPRELRRS